jgi:hypothetical protein
MVAVAQDEQPTPEQEQREFQAFLGKHHGLLSTVLEHREWFRTEGEGIDSLRDAYLGCCEQFGVAQGATQQRNLQIVVPSRLPAKEEVDRPATGDPPRMLERTKQVAGLRRTQWS